MIKPTKEDIGRFVVYDKGQSSEETGRIKELSMKPDGVRVVYDKPDRNWNAYKNYPSELTNINNLVYLY